MLNAACAPYNHTHDGDGETLVDVIATATTAPDPSTSSTTTAPMTTPPTDPATEAAAVDEARSTEIAAAQCRLALAMHRTAAGIALAPLVTYDDHLTRSDHDAARDADEVITREIVDEVLAQQATETACAEHPATAEALRSLSAELLAVLIGLVADCREGLEPGAPPGFEC